MTVAVELPEWLRDLWTTEVVRRVQRDPRSRGGRLLGLSRAEAIDAIGGGQAPFDEPHGDLSPADRVLLYAHFNQKGHLEELTEAFRMVFSNTVPCGLIVVDLGCGPATGGLALAGVLPSPTFDYIGVDQSQAMRRLGEHLAGCAPQLNQVRRRWADDLKAVDWDRAPGWQPVLVIDSYLLASPTLNPRRVVADLDELLTKLGNGRVTMLYTNSPKQGRNRKLSAFRAALCRRSPGLRQDRPRRAQSADGGRSEPGRCRPHLQPHAP